MGIASDPSEILENQHLSVRITQWCFTELEYFKSLFSVARATWIKGKTDFSRMAFERQHSYNVKIHLTGKQLTPSSHYFIGSIFLQTNPRHCIYLH